MNPTRAQLFLQMREEAGELQGSGCRSGHGGSKWVFKYVGLEEAPLYLVETVCKVEFGQSAVTKIPDTVRGDPNGCWILEPGFPDCRFLCQVLSKQF